ncbi:NAD(P)-binding protein [Aspergillus campestris IBT 28561]|uniref:NAD(P)-binding protein n=1 Tax=Aspergillus campestris (strain IBT 28561) TaxID=1392248 RepID=A0A2I1CYV4_ASPC2|nr:NAD(P)-binding protein [Aspergillus campestris IBT 28561]PKY02812.1 NAD(P)-binding protein [Aspergillus campestris IBT 28561]
MSAQQQNQRFSLDNVFNVKGKVALVTGGGSGIGLMATQALAVNGAKVYITGRTEEKLERVASLYSKDIPGQIIPLAADITSKPSIEHLVQQISAKEPALHILINNAGISSATQNTELTSAEELSSELFNKTSFEEWESLYRTNVSQLYFVTAAFLPLLQKGTEREHGWSSTVVNVSSISGIVKVAQHHFPYNASKGAAVHLTRMLAHEVASSGLKIRVNGIAPGVFPSEMTAGESDDTQKSSIPKENISMDRRLWWTVGMFWRLGRSSSIVWGFCKR